MPRRLNTLFQRGLVGNNPDNRHAVDKNVAFAEYLGCSTRPEDYRIVIDPMARERVKEFLQESGVAQGARIVYANPAARWETKYWTVEAWATLADLLIERAAAAVVLSGSPDDEPYIRSISGRMTQRPIIAAGKLSLAEAVALIEASDVYSWGGFRPYAYCRICRHSGCGAIRAYRPHKGGTVREGACSDPLH